MPQAPVTAPSDPTVAEADVTNQTADQPTDLVEADLLVEDVSIDGMCGVY